MAKKNLEGSVKLIFEISKKGRVGFNFPYLDVPEKPIPELINASFLRKDDLPELPEVSEVDVIRHYTNLSHRNYGVDSGFYPLGSCTMKYNPKINEDLAGLPGFENIHPLQPEFSVQGILCLISHLPALTENLRA